MPAFWRTRVVLKAQVEIKVPFHDIDILNVVWHGHYAKYFEIARTALMQSLDLDWPMLKNLGIAMPVIELHVTYRMPLLYDAIILAEAVIHETDLAELRVEYTLRESMRGSVLATGWTRQVYFSVDERQTLFSVPESIEQRFRAGGR